MENELKHVSKASAAKNSLWKIVESFGSKGVSTVVTLVLARLLLPEAYGVIGLTGIFIQLSDMLIQAGFSTALIRKEKVTDADYSTVFFISMGCATVLYALIFFSAPLISKFYETPELTAVLRILALGLFFQATGAVRGAIIARAMRFRTTMLCALVSNITSGTVAIILAAQGFGVWALVVQQLLANALSTILLFILVKIKIKPIFSMESLRQLLPPSLKILTSSLLSFSGDSVYGMAIGKVYSVAQLGYYGRGEQFPRDFSLYTFGAISSVFLPVFASYQSDLQQLRAVFRRTVNVCLFVIVPMMAGLWAVGDHVISFILTDTWLPAMPILKWACLYYTATPLMLANVQLHFAIGKPETRIKSETMRIILLFAAFIPLMVLNAPIELIMAVRALIEITIAITLLISTKKAIGYPLRWTLRDLLPTALSAILMCIAVLLVRRLQLPLFPMLVLEVATGVVVYVITSVLFKNTAFYEMLSILKTFLQSRRNANA